MNQHTPGYNGGISIEGSGVVLRYAPDSGIYLPATPAVTCWAIGIRLSSYRTGYIRNVVPLGLKLLCGSKQSIVTRILRIKRINTDI